MRWRSEPWDFQNPRVLGEDILMPRRRVEFRTGEYYHLYNRGHNRQKIFLERDNYLFFLTRLRDHLADEVCDIIAYCLMPNHYHLLVRLNSDDLSQALKTFGISYTKAINKRCGRVGPLYQGPFRAVHVDREDYLLHLSRYIHLNPVSARLVGLAEDWEFSSYPEYVHARNGSLPKPAVILSQFPSSDGYRQFVESGVGRDDRVIGHLVID